VSLATHSNFVASSHAAFAIYGRRTAKKTNLFLIQKRNSAGKIQKMQRLVFSGGARFGFAKTGGGASLISRHLLKLVLASA